MLKIGLTGGIGSGKSTVAACFAELKIDIIDADTIARELITSSIHKKKLLDAIAKHFGSTILTDTGELKRDQLRAIVFADTQARAWLENLLHPLIRTAIQERLQTLSSAYCVLMIPLLLEKNMHDWVDRILVIDASETLQIQRSMQRDKSNLQEIKAILDSQHTREQRLLQANDIIHNEGTLEELKQKVMQLHAYYLALVENKKSSN